MEFRVVARFNPRLPGGRRPVCQYPNSSNFLVSIHAFRGEGDGGGRVLRGEVARFNPRLPGGRRPSRAHRRLSAGCFNPRLPGGRRRDTRAPPRSGVQFQSTPSGGKATCLASCASRSNDAFQSTPSGGKATVALIDNPRNGGVSIHAFRGEGDAVTRRWSSNDSVSIHAFRGEGDRAPFFSSEVQI